MIIKLLKKISCLLNSKIESLLLNIQKDLEKILSYIDNSDNLRELICNYEDNDELKIYQGYGIKINNFVTIRQPTLGEICSYGEGRYYSMIHTLCSVGADLKWQLDDIGIDYTKISDYELFYSVLSKGYSTEDTKILFGNIIDFSKMKVMFNKELQENVLVQFFDDGNLLQIDKYVYSAIVDVLRKIHKIKRNDEQPGNEATRRILIEDAKEEYEENKGKPAKPYLLPLISSMVNSEGFKRNDITVFDMKIYPFMDSILRISKIKNSDLLLTSGYSGFGINLKDINKETINWMGELN